MSVVTDVLGKMYRKAAIKAMERGLRTDNCFFRTGDEVSLPATITHSNNIEPKWITMDDSQTFSSSYAITIPDVWDMQRDHNHPVWPPTLERCPYCSVRYLPEDRFCVGCGALV